MMMWLAVTAFATLLGVAMIWFGWRGRRINDHPWCRRCKYDLVGSAGVPSNCPECGADLTARRAFRIGQRYRRRAMVLVGSIVLSLAAGGGGVIGWDKAREFDWNTIKPFWWLKDDAISGTSVVADAAQDEILARLKAGNLTESQIRGLVPIALSAQGDLAAPWKGTWGDIFEEAWDRGSVDKEQIAQYLRQAIEAGLSVTARSPVHLGERLRVVLECRAVRLSNRSRTYAPDRDVLSALFELKAVHVESQRFEQGSFPNPVRLAVSRHGSSLSTLAIDLPLTTGLHELHFEMDFAVEKNPFGKYDSVPRHIVDADSLPSRWCGEYTCKVEVVGSR